MKLDGGADRLSHGPDRARQFAMTAIFQYRGAQMVAGRGRYSLWTGDIGLAIYLWDCVTGDARFPTIDVF